MSAGQRDGGPPSTGEGRRRGRRQGPTQTPGAVLAAARTSFAERGYERTTIRHVAAEAGVDPALVLHFFGSKDGLFRAALELVIDPTHTILAEFRSGSPDDLGVRMARFYFWLWEQPGVGQTLTAMLISSSTHPEAGAAIRGFLVEYVARPAAAEIGGEHAVVRVALAASHLLGVAFARYVLKVEPIAELTREQVIALVAPAVQRYLTEPLPLP